MNNPLTLVFFSTQSQKSIELKSMLSIIADREGFVFEDGQAYGFNFIDAARTKDIVIVDATREENSQDYYDVLFLSNDPMKMDHVLFTSRNYLPLNVFTVRYHSDRQYYRYRNIPDYPDSLSNNEIIKWLEQQINDLKRSWNGGGRPKDLIGLKTWNSSYTSQVQRFKDRGRIFISFRSGDVDDVARLKKRIEYGDYHNGEGQSVLYFPPGVLSSEFMTEQRRWQIVSIIRDRIQAADEIWIYESRGYYYNSWWTLAELFVLSYLRGSCPRVRIFNHETQELYDKPEDYLHVLSESQLDAGSKRFTNSHPEVMAPESLESMRLLSNWLPFVGFFKNRVFSKEYWNNPVLDCYRCRRIGSLGNKYNVDELLDTRGQNFTRFTPQQVKDALSLGNVTCSNPICNTLYQFSEGSPHYLWLPLGNSQAIAAVMDNTWEPISPFLIKMPTYAIG